MLSLQRALQCILVSSMASCFFFHSQLVSADNKNTVLAKQIKSATGALIVVNEGKKEPRSIGSYSLRIYANVRPEFPFDNFITGVIRPRDGGVEGVLLEDLNGDGMEEIIILIRSAGTGSYLSADAFFWDQNTLAFCTSVSGLAPEDDPVKALRRTQHPGLQHDQQ